MITVISIVLHFVGGSVFGPVLARIANGSALAGFFSGLLGAAGAYLGVPLLELGALTEGVGLAAHLEALAMGGAGGGAAGLLLGALTRRPALRR